MGKNKLQRFAEMAEYKHVVQPPYVDLMEKGHDLKGKWRSDFFKNDNPIVLELGCGKGEYTVSLGELFPNKNFLGVDIKGARMHKGAKESLSKGMGNVGFLRTNIELIAYFFEENEVDEIWITFPDPHMKKDKRRLTYTRMLQRYHQILKPEGVVHLKTDSNFLFTYTEEVVKANDFKVNVNTRDLYNSGIVDDILSIQTFYESQFMENNIPIKYLQFELDKQGPYINPDVDIEFDSYRSYNRGSKMSKSSSKG